MAPAAAARSRDGAHARRLKRNDQSASDGALLHWRARRHDRVDDAVDAQHRHRDISGEGIVAAPAALSSSASTAVVMLHCATSPASRNHAALMPQHACQRSRSEMTGERLLLRGHADARPPDESP